MASGIVLQLLLILAGIGTLTVAVLALARRRMLESLCLIWGFFSLLLIIAGIVLRPTMWNRYLSYSGLVLIGLAGVCLLIAAYFISVGISELLRRMRETVIQISLLQLEREGVRAESIEQKKRELLVVIPAFNESGNIKKFLSQLEAASVREYADIVVIDDGSTDRTRQIVEGMHFSCVSGIFNQGYGSALQTGYKYAVKQGYNYVVQADADGQHDAGNIKKIYDELRLPDGEGRLPDIVLGSRFLPGSVSFPVPRIKMLGIVLFRWVLKLFTGERITDPTTGLQGLNARTVWCYSRYGYFDDGYLDANIIMQMLLRGYRIREIPAMMHERSVGKGMHSGVRPVLYMFRMAFSISAVYIREKILKKERIPVYENMEKDI